MCMCPPKTLKKTFKWYQGSRYLKLKLSIIPPEDGKEFLVWTANGGHDQFLTEWWHVEVNIPATETVQILFKGYDVDEYLTRMSLDDIRIVEHKCGTVGHFLIKYILVLLKCRTLVLDTLKKWMN